MTEELTVDGKLYISSKRAAQQSQYSQDYVGQLARGGYIDAQRIGGLWYVHLESLLQYKKNSEEFVPQPPVQPKFNNQRADTLISFDGKDYVSASKGAEMTGYHQDYVGQLAREGKILSRQVGNRWYVQREDLLKHKEEKDRLLAAVQAQSVGIQSPPLSRTQGGVRTNEYAEPLMTYSRDDGDLIPPTIADAKKIATLQVTDTALSTDPKLGMDTFDDEEVANVVPIKIERKVSSVAWARPRSPGIDSGKHTNASVRAPRKSKKYAKMYVVGGLLVVTLLAGYIVTASESNGSGASIRAAVTRIGDILEPYITNELIYRRGA